MISLLIFGVLDGVIYPFYTVAIFANVSKPIIALSGAIFAICGLFSNYIGIKYNQIFNNKMFYLFPYAIDITFSILSVLLYQYQIISIDCYFIIVTISFKLVGMLPSNFNEYIRGIRYSGNTITQTGANMAKYNSCYNYFNYIGIILGSLGGWICSLYIKDLSLVFVLWYSTITCQICLLGRIIVYKLYKKNL